MSRRFLSILLAFVLVIMQCPILTIHAAEPTIVFSVTPDVTEAEPGDSITYTITLKTNENISGTQFYLDIPTGLTYVSGALDSNLKQTLNNANDDIGEVSYTENEKVFMANTAALEGLNNLSGGVTFGTFICTVDNDANGDYVAGLTVDVLTDGDVAPYPTEAYTVKTIAVHVTGICYHNVKTFHNAETPACNEQKNGAYYSCDNCTQLFAEDGTTPIASIPKLGLAEHTPGKVEDVKYLVSEGDCQTNKTYYQSCTVCEEKLLDKDTFIGSTKGDHVMSNTWTQENGQHFHKCTITNCTYKEDEAACSGGTATCTKQAICSVCEQPYGELVNHDYNAATVKVEALKSAGNCRDEAVYYYSCTACGKPEMNDNCTFKGAKDPSIHVGGTTVEGYVPADHKNQQDGSTGVTKCNGCGAELAPSQPIPAGEHQPGDFITDGTYHWKECTINGCGVVIDNTKEEHGWGSDYEYNATQHWYECSVCHAKKDLDNHDPSLPNGATEEEANICNDCLYEIQPKLNHTHKFDQKVAADKYKASGATCEDPATYYKSCKCGEAGTETFASGTAKGHTEGTTWKRDDDNHWHVCTECGVVIDSSVKEHTPDHEGGATEDYAVECKICHYEIEAKLPHEHVPGTEWKNNSSYHWHVCEKETCGAVIADSKEAHVDADHNRECDVCGYKLPEPEEEKPEGWIREAAKWYYYDNGKKVKGWKKVGKNWYFMKKTFPDYKAMQTGWIFDEGRWYYLAENGVMKTGWREIGGKWYYLGQSGAMKTGWFFDPDYNAWYYLHDENGDMLVNTTTPDGYYVGADGKWVQ